MAREVVRRTVAQSLHRWLYLLLGGAIGVAVGIVLAWPVQVIVTSGLPPVLIGVLVALLVAAPVVAVGALAEVRPVEAVAVGGLLARGFTDRPGPSTTAPQRARTALLLALHVLAGTAAGALLVIGVPSAVVLVAVPGGAGAEDLLGMAVPAGWPGRVVLTAGLLLLVVAGGELPGRGLAAVAPRLLAGSTAERLAAAEASVSVLTGRDRLARELHDSVGHALSLASVQAGAARRLLTRDPVAAEEAIRATEDATRRALVDLEHVLGLLREEEQAATDVAPAPDLRDLTELVGTARAAGAVVSVEVRGAVESLPALVSREAYRIVQEGLTNVLRYAPGTACRLVVDAAGDDLELVLANTGPGAAAAGAGGGRGLRGVRERVRDLRGEVRAGVGDDGRWQLAVRLPVHARSAVR
ncbi:histidine kinase [Modestobacter sp. VKM Ac-2979]|uniref:sensor histidine kinase n=1 Tax=unclassified Modestobacter TaxID=2643866 RepID=UPI0022AB87D5|nr:MULTISPECIES: histidine kinase [unclassified Modestobacter]MCZ2814232.1 histidine kinase [Modestobacter sp. VKM Ac-2979]MCZ2844076.1 histidine kinase [Modestobacter sp. VKM Ac-2980]